MADDLPIFRPGETIRFSIELEHDFYIGGAWAAFRLRDDARSDLFAIHLEAVSIAQIRNTYTGLLSQVVFESAPIGAAKPPPGDYELETIRGLLPGVQRNQPESVVDLGAPEVSFRIAQQSATPYGVVRYWALEAKDEGTRYLD